MDNRVAVLILFFNKLEETIACIESFIPSNQHIYILNNGSDKKLWNRLKQRYQNNVCISLFHSDINLGISIGRNYLIKKTSEPWLLIVDNDITAKNPDGWMESFNELVATRPQYDVFTLRIYNVHEKAYVKPIKIVKRGRTVTIETTDNIVTNCFPCTGSVINRNVFKTHGLLDERLFVFEDYEYGIRCMLSPQGELKVYHVKDIEFIHDHKFQKARVDKAAVRERYSEDRIRQSHLQITKKFDIDFDHSWEWWSKKQVTEMAGKSSLGKLKEVLVKYTRLRRNT